MAASVTTRICLSMIVRNEAATIERCLHSAAPLFDAAVVVDTGSSDGTAELVRRYLAERGCPGSVLSHPWRDFGVNRQAALDAARSFVAGLGWPLERTYWLLLDADLELLLARDFDRDALVADAVALRQQAGTLSYWNLRLARASLPWRVVGPTHEFYACETPPTAARLTSLSIFDHGDGGSKADKFPRDISLLTAYLGQCPDDPRTLFYLAQSFRAIGDPVKALAFYRRRIAIGDTSEEAWYARYRLGRLLAENGSAATATAVLLDAHEADPCRAEPLYELARLHRKNGQREEAARFANRGRRIPVPLERNLVHMDVYEHKLDLELACAARRTELHDEGFDACERLLLSRTTPEPAGDEARLAELAYVAPLRGCQFLPLRPRLAEPCRPCNPSILQSPDGYLVNCRAVNYQQRRLHYRPLDEDGIYRTTNVLMTLDRSFRVVEERPVVADEPPARDTKVRGFEDVRLFQSGDRLMMLCATTDRHPSGRVHQSLCHLDPRGRIVRHLPLIGAFDDRPQKNWLPYADPEGVHAVYGYNPFTLLTLDMGVGSYRVELVVNSPVDARRWRGSAGPILWPGSARGRRVLLVHDGVRRQGADGVWERVYVHRAVEYDGAFCPTRISKPFVFAHHGVEFACGMITSWEGDVLVTVGVEDREAYICRIPAGRFDEMLDENNDLLASLSARATVQELAACRA